MRMDLPIPGLLRSHPTPISPAPAGLVTELSGSRKPMSTSTIHPDTDAAPFAGYSPSEEKPLGGYATLMAAFSGMAGLFAAWFRHSGGELPDRVDAGDLALITVASHKASRLIAKDKVTSAIRAPFAQYEGPGGPGEVSERPRGRGLRRVIGELLICPYCLGMWTSAAMTAGLLVAPRFTRWTCTVLTAFFGADVLQIAYRRAERGL
jgi:hypothetical protein